MKKRIIVSVVITLLLIAVMAVTLTACSQVKTFDEYLSRGYIVVGVDDSFPPMGYRDKNDKIIGFDIDLANAVGEKLGIEFRIQKIDWEQKEMELKSGRIDAIWNGFTINEERKKNMAFSIPYMKNKQVIVVKSDSSYQSMADLMAKDDLLVCVQNSSTAEVAVAESDLKHKELLKVEDNISALNNELKSGRVDCVVMDLVVAEYKIKNDNTIRLLEGIELADEEFAVGMRKGEEDTVAKINEVLIELHDGGSINSVVRGIFAKYIDPFKADDMIIIPKK